MSELIEEAKEVGPNRKVVFVTAGEDFIEDEINILNIIRPLNKESIDKIKQETKMPYDRELFMIKNRFAPNIFLAMKKSRFAIAKYLVKDFISRKASYVLSLLNVKSYKLKETGCE